MKFGLIIQTVIKTPFIILSENEKILKISYIEENTPLSSSLFLYLQKILPQKSLLKYVATCIGPGSFTDLRIGAVVGKTLAHTLNIPLISFLSLETYQPQQPGLFANILDAKSSGIYSLEGEKSEHFSNFSSPQLLSLEKVHFPPGTSVFSFDWKIHKQKFPSLVVHPCKIDPIYLTKLVHKKFLEKKFSSGSLLYMR